MYTVLWVENGMDKWDRFETEEEVKELLKELEENENVCETDVWIFPPQTDDYACDYEMFMSK